MINRVTYRIIARKEKKNREGIVPICLQAFVNKERVVIPLSIYVEERYWNERERCIKNSHPEALYYNADISNARTSAAAIVTDANYKKVRLTRELFRSRIEQSVSNDDFVQFAFDELEKRKGEINNSTYLQHKSSLGKLKEFKKKIPFCEISASTVVDYERWLYRVKLNKINTVWAALKVFKTYLNLADMRGFQFPNPFKHFEMKRGHTNKVFCTIPELHALLNAYDARSLPEPLRESLLVFLVESFTSIRISDIRKIDRSWLVGEELSFAPKKTIKRQKRVRFQLPKIALRLLEDLFQLKHYKILKSDQKINDDLKRIADKCNIEKSLSTHSARHTFATTYLTLKGTEKGTVEVLQQIMGHARIETTMVYVHLVDERKNEQMKNFDNEFK
jgi:integrase/recombinase XerD